MLATIWLTNNCNLNCTYCYEGEKDGQMMDKDTAKATIDYLIKHAKQYGFDKIDVNFHGGEPLLNFEMMQFLVRELRVACAKNKLGFGFMFTTNGTIFNEEIADFLKQEQPCVTLSIDGDQKTHDSQRKYHNGKGSFEEVIKTGKQLQKLNILLFARMTFNSQTVNKLADNIELLINEGFEIVKPIPDYFDEGWDEEDIGRFSKELEKIIALESKYQAFITLIEGFRERRKMYPCKGGVNEINIAVDGQLYPCTYVAGDPLFVIGSVKAGVNHSIIAKQHKASLDANRELCFACSHHNYCEGYRCTYINYSLSGSLSVPSNAFCQLHHQLFAATEDFQLEGGEKYGKRK